MKSTTQLLRVYFGKKKGQFLPSFLIVSFSVLAGATLAACGMEEIGNNKQELSLKPKDEPALNNVFQAQSDFASAYKWIAGLDYGLRSDSGGAGYFKAPRGGGTRVHKGLDLLLPVGSNLYTPCAGRAYAGSDPQGYGTYAEVRCAMPTSLTGGQRVNVSFLYGHLSKINFSNGASVNPGQKIGEVGKSGNANSASINPHVHFEAIVQANLEGLNNFENTAPPQRNMIQREENFVQTNATAAGFATLLQKNCMNGLGFRATQGMAYGSDIDPFVLLTCLRAAKPAISTPTSQPLVRWSRFYAASSFDVNVGLK